MSNISEAIESIGDFVDGSMEGLRSLQLEIRGARKRRKLKNPVTSDSESIDAEEVLAQNPQFAIDLMAESLLYPRRTIIGIVPDALMVIALWSDKEGQAHAVSFRPRLFCNRNAMGDATGRESFVESDPGYYVFHTSHGFWRLRRAAKKMSDQFDYRIARYQAAISEDGIFDPSKVHESPLNYNKMTMSPINYLAASAREFISGEDIEQIILENLLDKKE